MEYSRSGYVNGEQGVIRTGLRVLAEKRLRPSFLNRAAAIEVLTPSASVGLRLHLLLDLVQRLLNVEGCRFLSPWEFLEGLEELSHDGLRWNHNPEFIAIPTRVHPRIRRHFERVRPEVNN